MSEWEKHLERVAMVGKCVSCKINGEDGRIRRVGKVLSLNYNQYGGCYFMIEIDGIIHGVDADQPIHTLD